MTRTIISPIYLKDKEYRGYIPLTSNSKHELAAIAGFCQEFKNLEEGHNYGLVQL